MRGIPGSLKSLLCCAIGVLPTGCENLDLPLPGGSQSDTVAADSKLSAEAPSPEEDMPTAQSTKPTAEELICGITGKPSFQVTDADLAELSGAETGLEVVTDLNLANARLSNAGLRSLSEMRNLSYLNLDDIRTISDVTLKHLARFESLEELRINDSACTEDAVRIYKKARPGCRVRLPNREY